MGIQRHLSLLEGNRRRETPAYKLSRDLQEWYATHLLSPWQREYVDSLRRQYEIGEHKLQNAHYRGAQVIASEFFGSEFEAKIDDHNKMHDVATSKLSEKFMQLELDYLNLTNEWKKNNPDREWHPSGLKGLITRAFWRNIYKRAQGLGIKWPHYGEAK